MKMQMTTASTTIANDGSNNPPPPQQQQQPPPPQQQQQQQRPREFASYDPRDPRAMYQQTQEETRRYMDMVNKKGVGGPPPPPMGPSPSPLQRPPSRGSDRGALPTSVHHPSPGGSGGPRAANPLPPHFHHTGEKRSSSPNHPSNVPRSPYPPSGLPPQQQQQQQQHPGPKPPQPMTSMSTPTKPRSSSPLASPRDLPPGGSRQHHPSSLSAKDHPRGKDDPSSKANSNEPKDLSSPSPRDRLPPGAAPPPHQRPPSSSPVPPPTSNPGQQPPPPQHVAGYPGYPMPYAYPGVPIEFYQRGIAPYPGAAAASPYARPPFLPPGAAAAVAAAQYPPGLPAGLASPAGQPGGPPRHPGQLPSRHPLDVQSSGKPGAPSPGSHLSGNATAIEMLKQQAENARQNHKIHELGQVGAGGGPAVSGPPPPTSRPFDGLPPTMRGSPSGLPPGHPGYSLPGYPTIIPGP